jgi:hypothetical protein
MNVASVPIAEIKRPPRPDGAGSLQVKLDPEFENR